MAATIPAGDDAPAYRPRSYQVEMFEASLKENIIVTMGTGSGKTHIALLRIMRELECNPQKLIWFLTPTVALCLQQFKAILEGIPAVRARTLTSLDKVEKWTEQPIWDAILKDMQVVVSTHAVLADAMSHGFVKITQLGLMVFDEAHHCMRRHPANKIMQDFYHPALARHGPNAVPKILGLTASPVMRSNRQELLKIESNLDAVCKTPRVHRSELLTHTHRPHLQQIMFTPVQLDDPQAGSETLRALVRSWSSLSIEDDPYIKKLRRGPLDGRALHHALSSGKTYCNEQLKRFVSRSLHIFEELGEWAADYFIHASVEQLKAGAQNPKNTSGWSDEEKAYLLDIVSRLPTPNIDLNSSDPAAFRISPKFQALLAFLDAKGEPEFSGLIFAKQRATVSVMEKLLSVHPLTKNRFRCAAYVGWSGGGSKDVLGELLDAQMQRDTLSEFRTGQKNLIVATDVLEEGIDISACSVVVCYDKPPNLKSFVQRRGRARHRESTYAIMFAVDDESSELSKWQDLERAMIDAYEDDERQLREAWALEALNEEVADRFEVESTGAVLTADTAVAHLNHFCAILPRQPYVDNDPEYSFEKDDAGLLRGTVLLPSCVHPAVRRTQGQRWWQTERAARKEAAFQAYKGLYEFGLLSDHLLPFKRNIELKASHPSNLPALIEVSEQYDPWVDWACSWSSPDVHQTRIAVHHNGDAHMCIRLTTPAGLPPVEPMTLFWDSETIFTLAFDTAERVTGIAAESIDSMRVATALYLQATSSRQLGPEQDYVTLFAPDLPHYELSGWLNEYAGYESALEVYSRNNFPAIMGIVRDRSRYSEPMLFRRWVVSGENASIVELECDPVPRRRNLLQRQTLATKPLDADASEPSSKMRVILADRCTIDRLSYSETIFGRFISAIIDRLEATLVATRLCETILRDIRFSSIRHVVTAITAPSAQSPTNYQRYEFFGDSVLKFTISCQLFFQHPNWHEGYLSEGRDEIVQNPRLARAALDVGLDAFIMTKMFTPRKWNAPLISEKISIAPRRRMMSMKVLADVVEALIGAAFIDGGFAAAHECICRFLPEANLEHIHKTENLVPKGNVTNHTLNDDQLMERIGYTFTDRSFLVEALTHPSCQFDATTQSYQRLEFLGDAVLDMVIISTLLDHPTEISQGDMTKIKHAVVNANLLAFFCMEFALVEERTRVEVGPTGGITLEASSEQVELWRFMRYQGQHLTNARDLALARHRTLRTSIVQDLEHSRAYPWQSLSQLSADKFFSDLIESILGAIFIDSRGNLAECIKFVDRIGLLWYLRRILTDGVHVMHPRNIAQQMAKGEIQFEAKRIPNEQDDGATYRCAVKMAGVEGVAVVVEGCLTSEEAEVTASNRAVEILTQRGYSL
ncbi:ATP-dependent helicase dcl2-1 [Aspergillus sclerotiicarbonarius CBS 121057]|uniref:ATP-dependent helicase dcl2-1 n=1 Tax=Aspergillus sclerotiicarbonarius (strain CBS 121057 / IBT 28362) TaxID=1448318 RepID=A0A319DSZ4_ASPSB|nr:ATP-dependent helicase dcl2-1 [Aspergillus sclerotiicarbonarius CBS 121057]